MRGIISLIDPLAEMLLRLRTVSAAQWLLRLVAAGAMLLALWATLPEGLFAHFQGGLLTVAVAALVLLQAFRPDTEIGLLTPLLILGALAVQQDLSFPRAAAIGFALLLSHVASALAATFPAHGVVESSARRLMLRSLLPVLALALLGGIVVVALSGIRLGVWTLVPGVLGAVALLAALLPQRR